MASCLQEGSGKELSVGYVEHGMIIRRLQGD